ncbi:hypothetical protein MKX01_016798 [Papaver californicum]|nr:hypothetical protein MKX01_016580 [Papaver californicum]KAI3989233.1 hypothetical protein MKX01_016798 [Papaver californicum]
MESGSSPVVRSPDAQVPPAPSQDSSAREGPSILSASGLASWAKSLKIQQPSPVAPEGSQTNSAKATLARLTSGLGLRSSPKAALPDETEGTSSNTQPGVFESLAKGLIDSSKSAVKAVQVKARHMVSQNKRRYQEGEFDLDMTYITENIIAMGFPAGDMSSGFFGYVEGFYRNHMEEVIKFFETHHKDKYKVYNLCSERLYDASLFEGKVACFPFDDHNCPPIQLITSFCQSAYSWLKEDIENVVVVHCKAGMARTGLMISSLLLYLKFFPTAEESMDYYNQKRCVDGKGLVLPSQIRYVKYFERILTYFNGENQPGRRCMLRGFRLHRCPYWIRPSITVSDHNGVLFSTTKYPRTKDMMPEDFWFSAPRKGIMVFALPGEPGLTELAGDFKIEFHDHQGDFYCWLNTTMIENRKILNTSDLDGFNKRKLPSPGFLLEVVLVNCDDSIQTTPTTADDTNKGMGESSASIPTNNGNGKTTIPDMSKSFSSSDKDDVFSDGETEETGHVSKQAQVASKEAAATGITADSKPSSTFEEAASISHKTEQVSLRRSGPPETPAATVRKSSEDGSASVEASAEGISDFKAIAADTSVFSFGDEDDDESD